MKSMSNKFRTDKRRYYLTQRVIHTKNVAMVTEINSLKKRFMKNRSLNGY